MDVKIISDQSSTIKVDQHIPCGYSMSTIWIFDSIKISMMYTKVKIS